MTESVAADPFAGVQKALDDARAAWAAASTPGLGVDGYSGSGLVRLNTAVGRLDAQVHAVQAQVAVRIADASRPELGNAGLARQEGFRSPQAMIAATTGTSTGAAGKLVAVGQATRPGERFGETTPPKYPSVASAIGDGRLSVDAAAAIVAMLDRVVLRAGKAPVADAEATLVEKARGLALDQLHRILQRAEAFLDPRGVGEREGELRAGRALHIREDRSGMVHLSATLDPETAAPIKSAIDALVSAEMRSRANAEDGDAAIGEPGRKSVPMMQADALALIARHVLGCDANDVPTAGATVIVRIGLEDLVSGDGHATIDGLAQPVSVGTARRMAAMNGILPLVLGGKSEILDFGRSRRLFSKAQAMVIAERDGGCVGCGLPPAFCRVHHIDWWDRDQGLTDMINAVLLCERCHHQIHDDGWEIRVEGTGVLARVSLIPPVHVDPTRTPRAGGRHRRDYRITA